ncbi:MAG: hypothetical protein GYB67_04505, partial [Chloroflexi bacterium]|nr:hypothetical protein [Chloroflexota bacterium]
QIGFVIEQPGGGTRFAPIEHYRNQLTEGEPLAAHLQAVAPGVYAAYQRVLAR